MDENTVELERIVIDFDQIDSWRDCENDDIPVCSFLSFYDACGLRQAIEKLCEEQEDGKIIAIEHLYCNFYTIQRIKRAIEQNWQTYSIDIVENNKVIWDTSKWAKNEKHYAKRLRPRVRNSINFDFINFCPCLDDNLEDNVIVLRKRIDMVDEKEVQQTQEEVE